MKIKALLASLLFAASCSASATVAHTGLFNVTTPDLSFSGIVLATIHLDSRNDLTGNVFSQETLSSPWLTLTLDHVVFTGVSLMSSSPWGAPSDSDPSATGFKFSNVDPGNYYLVASGHLEEGGTLPGQAMLGASYTVGAVPEPQFYAMLMAGLGLIGFAARKVKR